MAIKKFSEIALGTKFTLSGIEYVKMQEERISCCKFHNAIQTNNTSVKIGVTPITDVEVSE
jgi:hypothetical protein